MNNVKFNTINMPLPAAPVDTAQAEEMKDRIQEALAEMQQVRRSDYFERADMADVADMELLEAKLKASLTLINHFLATGEWVVPGGVGGTNQNGFGSPTNVFRDARPGWNGDLTLRMDPPPGFDFDFLEEEGLEDAEFGGFIHINDSDPTHETQLLFQASPDATKVWAFNLGKDIVYVEEGPNGKKYWVGREHATNLKAKILISGHGLRDHGINFDFHRTTRISDGSRGFLYGAPGGFNFYGSDFNDDIIGSQGRDLIRGFKGDDTLSGEGESDILYGDDGIWQDREGQIIDLSVIRQSLGLRTDLADGDDTLDGGIGNDALWGDGGVNTGVEDHTIGSTQESHQGISDYISGDRRTLSNGDWFDGGRSDGWGEINERSPGVVEISESEYSGNSELTLKMPPGFDQAFAEEDTATQGIRVTFIKHVDGQPPQTFVVVIRGALRNRNNDLLSPFTLRIVGNGEANIIDFHKVNMLNNNFVVEGTEENDMILAPTNELNQYGWSIEDLLDTANRYTERETSDSVNLVIPEQGEEGGENEAVIASVSGREIEVSHRPGAGGNSVHIDPSGFDMAYVMQARDDTTDLLVVLVKQGVDGGPPTTLVIRVDAYSNFGTLDDMSWLIIGPSSDEVESGSGVTPAAESWNGRKIYLVSTEVDGERVVGNYIDAGGGRDFVFRAEGDTVENADANEQIIGHFTPDATLDMPPPATELAMPAEPVDPTDLEEEDEDEDEGV